nr:MAG: nucleocapsid protein [Wufeng shrew rhabdovirus 6]
MATMDYEMSTSPMTIQQIQSEGDRMLKNLRRKFNAPSGVITYKDKNDDVVVISTGGVVFKIKGSQAPVTGLKLLTNPQDLGKWKGQQITATEADTEMAIRLVAQGIDSVLEYTLPNPKLVGPPTQPKPSTSKTQKMSSAPKNFYEMATKMYSDINYDQITLKQYMPGDLAGLPLCTYPEDTDLNSIWAVISDIYAGEGELTEDNCKAIGAAVYEGYADNYLSGRKYPNTLNMNYEILQPPTGVNIYHAPEGLTPEEHRCVLWLACALLPRLIVSSEAQWNRANSNIDQWRTYTTASTLFHLSTSGFAILKSVLTNLRSRAGLNCGRGTINFRYLADPMIHLVEERLNNGVAPPDIAPKKSFLSVGLKMKGFTLINLLKQAARTHCRDENGILYIVVASKLKAMEDLVRAYTECQTRVQGDQLYWYSQILSQDFEAEFSIRARSITAQFLLFLLGSEDSTMPGVQVYGENRRLLWEIAQATIRALGSEQLNMIENPANLTDGATPEVVAKVAQILEKRSRDHIDVQDDEEDDSESSTSLPAFKRKRTNFDIDELEPNLGAAGDMSTVVI